MMNMQDEAPEEKQARDELVTWMWTPDTFAKMRTLIMLGASIAYGSFFINSLASAPVTSTFMHSQISVPQYDPLLDNFLAVQPSGVQLRIDSTSTLASSASGPCSLLPVAFQMVCGASSYNDRYFEFYQTAMDATAGILVQEVADTNLSLGLRFLGMVTSAIVFLSVLAQGLTQIIKTPNSKNTVYNVLIYMNGFNILSEIEVVGTMVIYAISAAVISGVRDRMDVMLVAFFTLVVFASQQNMLYASSFNCRLVKAKLGEGKRQDYAEERPFDPVKAYRRMSLSFFFSTGLKLLWLLMLIIAANNYYMTTIPAFGGFVATVPMWFNYIAIIPSSIYIGLNIIITSIGWMQLWDTDSNTFAYADWLQSSLHYISIARSFNFLFFYNQLMIYIIVATGSFAA